jgi:fibro-slime domain-containing protein
MTYSGVARAAGGVAATAVAIAIASVGCGRTELDQLQPCDPTVDMPRPCTGFCGAGTQSCVAGVWEPTCDVPVMTRACSNDCGAGTESCFDKQWHTCEVAPATRSCSTVCGDGHESCADGTWGACDAPQPRPPTLSAKVRDFHAHQPTDFELPVTGDNTDLGIVASALGADNTPVYAGNPTTPTTSGAATFYEWYHDVPGVNLSTMISLPLMPSAGAAEFYVYSNLAFFPIDNQLFGNEGNNHNFHFTLEAHTHFVYRGGEIFSFAGDDDTWVFINRTLAIDLGGVHATESATIQLDAAASGLGMVKGQDYELDIFFAERHTTGSTFTIRTSIADASSCP